MELRGEGVCGREESEEATVTASKRVGSMSILFEEERRLSTRAG